MAEIYGHRWGSQHGDTPSRTWCRAIEKLTPEQVQRGFDACLARTDGWPPVLSEFCHLCLDYDPNAWERQCHKIDESVKLEDITERERRIEQGKINIKKLREEVGI